MKPIWLSPIFRLVAPLEPCRHGLTPRPDQQFSMSDLSLTLSSCFLREFLAETEVEPSRQRRLLKLAGISSVTLTAANGRITEDQFSTLYRLIARQMNDEMLNLLSSPVPGGTKWMWWRDQVQITSRSSLAVSSIRTTLTRQCSRVSRCSRSTGENAYARCRHVLIHHVDARHCQAGWTGSHRAH